MRYVTENACQRKENVMNTNYFAPYGLHILPDGTLHRTLFEYRYALHVLRSGSRYPVKDKNHSHLSLVIGRVETQVREAIQMIETEMKARGLESDAANEKTDDTGPC